MSFFRKLFGGAKTKTEEAGHESLRGTGEIQSEAEQASTRERMEAEMAADQERRRLQHEGESKTP